MRVLWVDVGCKGRGGRVVSAQAHDRQQLLVKCRLKANPRRGRITSLSADGISASHTIMAAHAIAVERGAEGASKILKHPEAGSDLFVEAVRLTYAQILGAPIIIEAYPMPTKRGSVIDAAVINPLMSARNEEESKRIVDRYDQFLQGDRMDHYCPAKCRRESVG